MQINHNLTALNTYNYMETNTKASSASISKLSSGLRINKAGDDAAGLAISEKMRAQIRGLDQAGRNAQDGVSMIQTAEGGLNEVHSILQRMRELADQSANGTNTADDRDAIQTEVTQLKSEIDRIGNTTEFNTQKLLNGNLQSTGAAVGSNQTMGGVIGKLTAAKMTANISIGGISVVSSWAKDTLTIDGQAVEVNWDTLLTQDQKDMLDRDHSGDNATQMNQVKDLLINTVNTAIDNFNGSTGQNVQHVTGYVDSSHKMVMESGTKGVKSQIGLIPGAVGTVADKFLTSQTTAGSVVSLTANPGTNVYNGTSVAAATVFDFKVNGIQLKGTISTAISAGTTMAATASILQTALDTAISAYNSINSLVDGRDAGYIRLAKVTADDTGRLIVADESGDITLADRSGVSAVSDLGLSAAQTEAAGNGGMTFQIGANKNQTITFGINDMRTAALGISGIDVSSAAGAQTALTSLDGAIKKVSSERAKIGAIQNRLEHTANNLSTSSENLTAAESRIRDVDMAKEMMNFQKTNILTQAAQAMMAQANQQPQGVLQLLR